ncbi:MAG: NTP transferase domain-containing protein [Bacteroidales bacterium]|nr:NTP transferase domain-containing protein [Bacteroidales bacterium]
MKEALFAQTSCIILAAGNSVRMGTDKALLKFNADQTFLQKISEAYLLAGIEQVIVVVNSELFILIRESNHNLSKKVLLVINDKPELGRFYSLQTGIKFLKPGNSCFFQNIDNPFTSEKLLCELIIFKDTADVIMPTYQKKSGHPVLISPLLAQEILRTYNSDLRIDLFLKQFEVKKTETIDPNILVNINSPEDYSSWM